MKGSFVMNEQQSNENIVTLKQQIEELKQKNAELQSNVSKGLEENKDKNEHSIKKILIIMGSLTIILLGLLVGSLVTKNIREDAWCSHPEIYDLLDKPAIYVYGNKDSNEQIQNYTVSLTTNNENNKIKTIYPNATIDGNTYSWNISVDKNKSGMLKVILIMNLIMVFVLKVLIQKISWKKNYILWVLMKKKSTTLLYIGCL